MDDNCHGETFFKPESGTCRFIHNVVVEFAYFPKKRIQNKRVLKMFVTTMVTNGKRTRDTFIPNMLGWGVIVVLNEEQRKWMVETAAKWLGNWKIRSILLKEKTRKKRIAVQVKKTILILFAVCHISTETNGTLASSSMWLQWLLDAWLTAASIRMNATGTRTRITVVIG